MYVIVSIDCKTYSCGWEGYILGMNIPRIFREHAVVSANSSKGMQLENTGVVKVVAEVSTIVLVLVTVSVALCLSKTCQNNLFSG